MFCILPTTRLAMEGWPVEEAPDASGQFQPHAQSRRRHRHRADRYDPAYRPARPYMLSISWPACGRAMQLAARSPGLPTEYFHGTAMGRIDPSVARLCESRSSSRGNGQFFPTRHGWSSARCFLLSLLAIFFMRGAYWHLEQPRGRVELEFVCDAPAGTKLVPHRDRRRSGAGIGRDESYGRRKIFPARAREGRPELQVCLAELYRARYRIERASGACDAGLRDVAGPRGQCAGDRNAAAAGTKPAGLPHHHRWTVEHGHYQAEEAITIEALATHCGIALPRDTCFPYRSYGVWSASSA